MYMSYNIITVLLVFKILFSSIRTLYFVFLFRFALFLNLQLVCTIYMYMFLCV